MSRFASEEERFRGDGLLVDLMVLRLRAGGEDTLGGDGPPQISNTPAVTAMTNLFQMLLQELCAAL